jgi:hypothetical protein
MLAIVHAAKSAGMSATTIIGLVLAAVGMGLTIHPPARGRLTRVGAFGCYLIAGELLMLLVSGVSVIARVGAGIVAVTLFVAWEWATSRRWLPHSTRRRKATTADARKATAAGQLSSPEALIHDLRWHLHKGQALEARVRGGSFGYVLTLLPEIETWTQQVHARLQRHPDLARRFLDAHPGFDSSNPASQFLDAQPIMSARVASLEEIIGELNGKRRQGARSGEPTSELREDSSSRQAWGKPDEKAG